MGCARRSCAVHAPANPSSYPSAFLPDSRQAWVRLALAVLIGSIGSVGMWSVVVVLPVVQGEFGATRGAVSLAFTLTMLGFGSGGVLTGKITDRFGIVMAITLSIGVLALAYVAAGLSTTLWQFILVHFLIGLGTSATFGPLMAEASHWFERYRGLAVTIVASGNYVGGTIWPPLVNWGIQTAGWRATHIAIGIFCAVAMTIVLLVLRGQIGKAVKRSHANAPPPRVDLRLSTNTLSLMMAFGVISRIGSGFLADKIGGIRTLLIGSVAQGFALLFYLFFDSLTSLYVISAMFGLFQGGIVPSYAIIVRESMPASEAATRVGIVILASVVGMSFGGWVSGVIFDATGSYAAAFLNGLGWNALNIAIMVALLIRARQRLALA